MDQIAAEIDRCNALFLCELLEKSDCLLHLVVRQGIPAPRMARILYKDYDLGYGTPIEPEGPIYQITWDSHVVYCVTAQLYEAGDGQGEIFAGNRFRLYSKSDFLDNFLSKSEVAQAFADPLQHIRIICERHIVDVISRGSPRISRLSNVETK